ncbi:hypothetical protein Tsubulata_004949, partial [Turnera subulata]
MTRRNPSLKIPKTTQASASKTLSLSLNDDACKQGSLEEAFESFTASLSDRSASCQVYPDEVYAQVLELCATNEALLQGRQIHAHVIKSSTGLDSVFMDSKLVFMYGKCGSLSDAEKVFEQMHERTVFTWSAMVGAYIWNGEPLGAIEMYGRMRALGARLDSYIFSSVLKACGAVQDVRCGAEIHGLVIKCGFDSILFVANALIAMYAKCYDVDMARKLFDRMHSKGDVVSWNPIITSYSATGQCTEALRLFREMQMTGVRASTFTFVAALQACEDISFRKLGAEIHAAILKSGQSRHVYVANALLAMYFRFGLVEEAVEIFDKLDGKDDVTWNSMLAGFIQNDLYDDALQFFYNLQDAGLSPDYVSITDIIVASGRFGCLLNGKELHAYAIRRGFDSSIQLVNSLIDMYAKCCCMSYAGRAFDKMPDKDFISWTTVIAGYANNNCNVEALRSFRKLLMEGMQVKEIHGFTIRKGLSDLMLLNTILDAYGDCGSINYATCMFESVKHKDVVSWTSMISSYVQNGLANEAFKVLNLMINSGIEPDSITLVSILSAAASLSALKKGKEIHGFIIRRDFIVEGSISKSLVDMYARCGTLENAYKVFTCTKIENLVLYTTMIHAYGMHGRGKEAVKLFVRMMDHGQIPDHVTFLVVLYACSHSGLVEEGKRILKIMKRECQLEPWPEHYACLVDLLGRANCLEEAYQFVKSMPIKPTAEIWCALLRACQVHSNKELGEVAARKLLDLDPDSPGNYVLISNGFASSGRWKDVEA